MSDIRFIIIGSIVVFSGFVILGIFGENYQTTDIEKNEFGNCFVYFDDKDPVQIDCSKKEFDQNFFFGFFIGLISLGVGLLIKGMRGNWDSKVKPEDMVGPKRDNRSDVDSPS